MLKRICAGALTMAVTMLMACSALAQDITIGDQPDLVIGAKPVKTISEPRAVTSRREAPKSVEAPAQVGRAWAVETKDLTLANTFQRWAAVAGWRVRWDADKHVMVEAPDTFNGTFEDAVESQLSSLGIAFSAFPLEVCFYPNTPPLARITRKGDQTKECK